MAVWTVSDELDARLRKYLGKQEVAEYVERIVADQLDYDEDPNHRAQVDAQITRSIAEYERGEGIDARQAMREMAAELGIKLRR